MILHNFIVSDKIFFVIIAGNVGAYNVPSSRIGMQQHTIASILISFHYLLLCVLSYYFQGVVNLFS